jgi:hypothetical protein
MTMVERGALAQRKREGSHLVHAGQPGRRAKEMKKKRDRVPFRFLPFCNCELNNDFNELRI